MIREKWSGKLTVKLSYDEKPVIQAMGIIYPDKPSDEENGYVSRNHDYKRNGALSLLSGIDLLTGQIIHWWKRGIEALNL